MHNKKILLMGDSITAGFDTQTLLPEFSIINKGLSANNSSHLLKRLERELLVSNPDIIFILIGTNDIAKGIADAEIIANIKSIVEISSENIPLNSIFITSILPTRNNELRPNERIMDLNKKIKLTAESLKVNYLNLYSNFVDETGQLIIDLTDDGLHLNEKAYLKWAGFLKNILTYKLRQD